MTPSVSIYTNSLTPTSWTDSQPRDKGEQRREDTRDQTERIPKDPLRSEAFFKVNSFFSFRVYHPKKKLSASTLLYSFCKSMLRRMRNLNFVLNPSPTNTQQHTFFYCRRIVCWSTSLCICVLFTGLGHLKLEISTFGHPGRSRFGVHLFDQ
jgi:hypothetical protein